VAFLITAYAVIIAAILGYAVRLWVAERTCRRRMETLLGSDSTP
jgi:hypothetical protein